jgi:hypothetical protein
MNKLTSTLTGMVTAFDGRLFYITCPNAPADLQVLVLDRQQIGDAAVGDTVTVGYFETPSLGSWRVVR